MNKMPTSFYKAPIGSAMKMSKEKPKKQAKKTLKEKRKDKKQKNA